MGEGITAAINVKSGDTVVSIYLRNEISPECIDKLRLFIEQWAQECCLELAGVNAQLRWRGNGRGQSRSRQNAPAERKARKAPGKETK